MITDGELRARLAAIPGIAPMLQEFFLASPMAFQIYSLEGRSLMVNKAFLDMFGSEPPPEYCLFEDSIALDLGHVPAMRAAFAGGNPVHLPAVWYSPTAITNVKIETGSWIAMETVVFPIRGEDGTVKYGGLAFKDVTKEERYLAGLKESQFLLDKAQEIAELGSWSLELAPGSRTFWSKNEYRIFGVEDGKFGGTIEAFSSMIHPEDRELVGRTFNGIVENGGSVSTSFRVMRPSGEVRWVSERAELVPGHGDIPPRIVGVTRDITEAKRAEEQVKASQDRFRSLFDSALFGYFVAKADGTIVDANDAFLKLTGYSRADLQEGKISWKSITPRDFADLDARALAQLQAHDNCSAYEKEFLRKDGTRVPILVGGSWADASRTEILSFAHDLSDQKRLEQQFQQAQRLESIGRLAGGVAHDFNNILGIILLYLDDLKTELLDGATRRDRIDSINRHVHRAIRLTKQLLAFGRRQVRAPRPVRINVVIDEMKEMLGRVVPESAQLEYALADSLPAVKTDVSQLEQVILNLVSNARDAVTENGLIRIETGVVDLSFEDFARLRLAVANPGPYVRLTVSDNGSGIDPRLLPHIYEPFFTTKDVGKGTGLGLATVYGVVRQSGGDVRVITELGRGTTFELYFPVDASVPATPGAGKARPESGALRSGVVLLVEDQAELRQLIRDILAEKGFRVIEASSGREALAASVDWVDSPDLVITDVIMPGMSGPAFVRALEQVKGQAYPVIYVSGYPETELVRHGVEWEGLSVLEKPFTREAFLERIKAFLGN